MSEKKRSAKSGKKVMYAVFVNDEMNPRSLCKKKEWAETYLGDSRLFNPDANVRVVKVTLQELTNT